MSGISSSQVSLWTFLEHPWTSSFTRSFNTQKMALPPPLQPTQQSPPSCPGGPGCRYCTKVSKSLLFYALFYLRGWDPRWEPPHNKVCQCLEKKKKMPLVLWKKQRLLHLSSLRIRVSWVAKRAKNWGIVLWHHSRYLVLPEWVSVVFDRLIIWV